MLWPIVSPRAASITFSACSGASAAHIKNPWQWEALASFVLQKIEGGISELKQTASQHEAHCLRGTRLSLSINQILAACELSDGLAYIQTCVTTWFKQCTLCACVFISRAGGMFSVPRTLHRCRPFTNQPDNVRFRPQSFCRTSEHEL